MNNSINQRESISAMADGELSDAQLDSLLASLDDASGKDTWEIYHQIGDVLRSEELAVTFSADFSQKFSARLENEPLILAPAALKKNRSDQERNKKNFLGTYAAVASVAVAGIFAFIMVPQLQIFHGNQNEPALISKNMPAANVQLAAHTESMPVSALALNAHANQGNEKNAAATEKQAVEIEMLRDPRIDSYLMAHQRFSPAINSGAQYVTHADAVSAATEK